MAIQFIKPEAAKCFSGIQGAFSEVSKSDSTTAKVALVFKTIILLPFLFIKDSLDLVTRPFRSVKKLSYKEQLSYAVKYAGLKVKGGIQAAKNSPAFKYAKSKAKNGIKAVKNFDTKNISTTTKVAVSAGLLIGSIYIYKNGIPFYNKEKTLSEKLLNNIYPIALGTTATLVSVIGLCLHRKRAKATNATSEHSKPVKTDSQKLDELKKTIRNFYDTHLDITFDISTDSIEILLRSKYDSFPKITTYTELVSFIRSNSETDYSKWSSDDAVVESESTAMMRTLKEKMEAN